MKLFIKLMLLLLMAALAGPFILKGSDGRPLMTLDKLSGSDTAVSSPGGTGADAGKSTAEPAAPLSQQDRQVYQWQDEQGRWHFSDRPPTKVDGEVVDLEARINTVPPARSSAGSAAESRREPAVTAPQEGVSVQNAAELMERARDVERLLQERKQQMDQAIEQH